MAVASVLEPLIAAGLTVAIRPDGRLVVAPSERITAALDVHIRTHRDDLITALEAIPKLTDWPQPRPAWWAEWMRDDDARRAATMTRAKARLAARHNRTPETTL
ncbi:MAG TPA: hypothetical protein VND88_04100 [Candidatus Acidoferrales bacterium]|nr:hypothetical protein [Candidatus Acidoferrales bacterium]